MEEIILVDEQDKEVGTGEKMQVHRDCLLHRAFSIFVFNNEGSLLLQKRANKYHSPGLWTNTCCSHPRKGETIEKAAHRRLREEMGFDCSLREALSFIYKVKLGEIWEHELDHVLIGKCEPQVNPNKDEVSDFRWISLEDLKKDIQENPDNYTYWFKMALEKLLQQNNLF